MDAQAEYSAVCKKKMEASELEQSAELSIEAVPEF